MTWDKTSPAGTDLVSLGDDEIREMKTDIEDALSTDGVFPGSTPSVPIFRFRGGKGDTASRPAVADGGLYFDTDEEALFRSDGATYEQVAVNFPATTALVFFQAAAPTGWTKQAVENDKFLRVVTGSGGGSAGSWAALGPGTLQFQTAFYDFASGIGDSRLEFFTSGGSNVDVFSKGWANPGGTDQDGVKMIPADSDATYYTKSGTGATSAHGSTQHAYIDVIIATKD